MVFFSIFLPYSSFAYIFWILTLCFYGIPESVNEWLSASISVFYAFSWAHSSTWKNNFAVSVVVKYMHYPWYSNSFTGTSYQKHMYIFNINETCGRMILSLQNRINPVPKNPTTGKVHVFKYRHYTAKKIKNL